MFHVIIPARYASTRLPGKPLQQIAGKPMVQHVWEQACKSGAASVTMATDDPRIVEACQAFGAAVVLTREDHPSGTDRLQEVVSQLGLANDACVVNVQGDEPLIPPAVIDQVAANLLAASDAGIATLAEPITDSETLFNPNAVVHRCPGVAFSSLMDRRRCLSRFPFGATSASMRTRSAFCMPMSAGRRARWKRPSVLSSYAHFGLVPAFMLPTRARACRQGSILLRIWPVYGRCWSRHEAGAVCLSG